MKSIAFKKLKVKIIPIKLVIIFDVFKIISMDIV